ncbi:YfhO family protein [Enterococcus rotai]|uniref:YfhO family protein n=1 Tax=Enterococcus rotai TaxID=118060 RepID=UPI0032B61BEC
MKSRWIVFFKRNSLFLALSFLIPVTVLGINYFLLGIYPTSDRTLLASDSSHQFVNFYAAFNNALHGKQSLFYTWSGSIGLNFWTLIGYYLGGLFTLIVFFFKNLHMPDAIYVITLLKFGAAGLSFWVFAHNTYYHINQWTKLMLSSCYALISYSLAYSPMIMWLDGIVYLPLVILGIHRLMDEKKRGLLYISYFLLFISNYYIGFMVGMFSFFYFFVRFYTDSKRYKSSILPYVITSLLAGGASMIVILPTILDLGNNGESLDTFDHLITSGVGVWDVLVKSLPGVYDTTKYNGSPFIYMGLLPLLFLIFYFVSKKIPRKNKILYGSLVILLIASVYFDPLNLVWHGLHYPNMFLFRFAFLLPAFGIILSGYGLEKFEKDDFIIFIRIVIVFASVSLLVFIFSNKKRYGFLSNQTMIFLILGLFFYGIVIFLQQKNKRFIQSFSLLLLLGVSIELFFNTKSILYGVSHEWVYPSRKEYSEDFSQVEVLLNQAKKRSNHFFRLENLDKRTFNESFAHDYYGVSMFSSVRNRKSSSYLNELGYKSNGTNLSISYENNTIVMDSLLGIKYNISKQNVMKYGFKKVAAEKDFSLYENTLALPMGVLTDEKIYEELYSTSQPGLLANLSGIEKASAVFGFTDLKEVNKENTEIVEEGDQEIFTAILPLKKQSITWEVTVPAHSQAYLNLSVIDVEDVTAEVSVNNVTRSYTVAKSGEYINLGSYDEARKIPVTLSFSGRQSVRTLRPSVSILNTELLQESINKIREKEVSFEISNCKAEASIDAKKDQVLFTTIPYDKGWKATVDGKKVEIKALQNALITIPISKGKHKIVLNYFPQGLLIGILLFVSCSTIFIIYQLFSHKK